MFLASPEFRDELGEADDLRDAVQEVENLYKAWEGRVDVRGTYSTVGFRADADLMLWLVGRSPARRAAVPRRVPAHARRATRWTSTWTFMGVVKPAEFTPDHQPAFVKGAPPETFLCVYPFVRTPEWYLLPREERGELLREHGMRRA